MDPSTPLHSPDPLEKAQGRLLVERFSKMIRPFYGVMTAKAETEAECAEKRQEIFAELLSTLEGMNTELGKKATKFFSGDKVGMTDLMVWPWIGTVLS